MKKLEKVNVMKKGVVPTGLAIIICDQIIEDAITGKKSIIGIFNNIQTKSFPCIHQSLYLFISITDGRGTYAGMVKCIRLKDNHEIFHLPVKVKFNSPMDVLEYNIHIKDIVFEEEGLYSFVLECNGIIVIEKRFSVIKLNN